MSRPKGLVYQCCYQSVVNPGLKTTSQDIGDFKVYKSIECYSQIYSVYKVALEQLRAFSNSSLTHPRQYFGPTGKGMWMWIIRYETVYFLISAPAHQLPQWRLMTIP